MYSASTLINVLAMTLRRCWLDTKKLFLTLSYQVVILLPVLSEKIVFETVFILFAFCCTKLLCEVCAEQLFGGILGKIELFEPKLAIQHSQKANLGIW